MQKVCSKEQLVIFAGQVSSNAHGIVDFEGHNNNVCVGVYPFVSMINHSCNPNACFVGVPGGALSLHAISPIASGEEITTAYCDTYLGTKYILHFPPPPHFSFPPSFSLLFV